MYDVTYVVTAGSPVGRIVIPDNVQMLSLETKGDIAVVVLGGDHHVPGACGAGVGSPFGRVAQIGIEPVEVPLIVHIGQIFCGAHPLAAPPAGEASCCSISRHRTPLPAPTTSSRHCVPCSPATC
nr:hypothetical protein [Lentzea atacamensis]